MANEIKTTYHGIEIKYLERENQWEFELRGTMEKRLSLDEAKKRIDFVPKEKRATKKFTAWGQKDRYSHDPEDLELVSVGAYTSGRFGGSGDYWITAGKERLKVSEDYLYADSAKNGQLIAKIKELAKERDALQDQISTLEERLVKVGPPAKEEVA